MSVPETELVHDDDDDETFDDEDTEDVENDDPATDNVGDPSVEINVEELLQTLESELPAGLEHKVSGARHRLEELMESRRAKRDLEDFDDYKF